MTGPRALCVAAILALAALAACDSRTSVLVTVDVDPAFASQVRQLRFETRLMRGDTVLTEDTQNNPASPSSKPLSFPNSFVVVADGRGKDSEIIEVFVEGINAAGDGVARARGSAPVVSGKETSMQLRLGAPCGQPSECVAAGTAFCDDPHLCLCEGDTCNEGFCVPVPLDDGNSCTETSCNEAAQIVTVVPVEDGTTCGRRGSATLSCAGGLCGCGDGATNPDVEQCDEGEANANEPNRCRSVPACSLPVCGDGILDDREPFFEQCDDGEANSFAPDACRPNCKLPTCGDFIQDTGEECDEGAGNDDDAPLACRTDCLTPHCGDGVVDVGNAFGSVLEEECDLGAMNSDTDVDGCRQSIALENGTGATVECKLAFCGDAVTDTGERCDDNNSVNGDGCNPTCNLLGDVSLLAGAPGGPGNTDGAGDRARLRDVRGLAVAGGFGYFTTDETHDPQNDHTIRRVEIATGNVVTLAGFPGVSGDADGTGSDARLRLPRGVAVAGTDLYIADALNHKLKHLDLTTNAVVTLAGTGSSGSVDGPLASAQFAQPSFVAARTATELLVVDTREDNCRLRQVDLLSGTVTTIAGGGFCFPIDGAGASAFIGEVSGIVMGPEPYLYLADESVIRRVDLSASPAVVETVAGSDVGFVDDIGTAARFSALLGMVVAGASNELYVADEGNNAIRHIDLGTMTVTTVALTDSLSAPRSLGIDGDTLLVAERSSHTLLAGDLAAAPLNLSVLVGKPEQAGTANGTAADARFDLPVGLAVGTSTATLDRLYVAGQQNATVRVIDLGAADNDVTTLPISGSFAFAFDVTSDSGRLFATLISGANGVLHELDPVTGASVGIGAAIVDVTTIRAGAVLGGYAYVVSPVTAVIRRIDLTTGVDELYSGQTGNPGVGDGDVSVARFGTPYGIVTCAGNLYVSESARPFQSHVIRRIDVAAGVVDTIAGAVTTPGAVDADIGADARFDSPESIACDGTNLYVADRGSNLIRQIELATGRVTTLAGVAYQAGAIDGIGSNARFNTPKGLTYDPTTGNLYVTDSIENVVRVIR